MEKVHAQCLPMLLKLYIYGLHGYFVEVTFTALWDLVTVRDWRLKGCSSIWSLWIYGTCGLALEKLSKSLQSRGVPIYLRSIIYVLLIYFWEFTSGALLSYMNACPWDYLEFTYNFGGLITLEYAPFWLITGLLTEKVIMGRLEQLRWIESSRGVYSQNGNGIATANGAVKMK